MYQPPNEQPQYWQPNTGYGVPQQPPSSPHHYGAPSSPYYPQQQPYYTPPPQVPMPQLKKSRTWLWIVALFVVFFVGVGFGHAGASSSDTTATTTASTASSTDTTTQQVQPTQAPTPTSKPTQAPKWVTVQKFTGSGSKKTASFTVGDNWAIGWACAPNSSAIGSYNVIVDVYNSDGTPADPGAINTICKPGNTSDQTQEHQGGNIYLDIQSEGDWSIVIQNLQ